MSYYLAVNGGTSATWGKEALLCTVSLSQAACVRVCVW